MSDLAAVRTNHVRGGLRNLDKAAPMGDGLGLFCALNGGGQGIFSLSRRSDWVTGWAYSVHSGLLEDTLQ
eukprot:6447145-Pyramimonas_sp.AAC.1